jgi:3-methyladenine DNA glycosylase AlkD
MLGYLRCDYLTLKGYVESFLPYLDNWAVCDSFCASIKNLFKEPDKSYDFLIGLLKSDKAYTVRFLLVCLLDYYINESYIDKLTYIVKEVKSNEYYINMALAWLISIMLVKEYDKTLPLLKDGALDLWVHNKSIQKARESYRLSLKQKEELRSLKR